MGTRSCRAFEAGRLSPAAIILPVIIADSPCRVASPGLPFRGTVQTNRRPAVNPIDALIAASGQWLGTNTLQDPNTGQPEETPLTAIGHRDRVIIAAMVYSFARVGAMPAMKVEDYCTQGKRCRVRLHEKGGKEHEMPAHHNLEDYIDAYVKVAGIGAAKKGPLFRSAKGRTGTLS
jgi:hypothetical protein